MFKWSIYMDGDFFKYSLFSSDNESMENKEILFESSVRIDTMFSQKTVIEEEYYQVQVMNLDQEKSFSNIIVKPLTPVMFVKTFGGSEMEYGRSVQQTTDDGYIITGEMDRDVWLLKTNSNGDSLCQKPLVEILLIKVIPYNKLQMVVISLQGILGLSEMVILMSG